MTDRTESDDHIWGINTVAAMLDSSPDRIHKLYLLRGRRNPRLQHLYARAREAGVPISPVPRDALDRLADGPHQGVVAAVGAVVGSDWHRAVEAAFERNETPLLVVLDHLHDPHNLGAIARSAAAFGAHSLVVPRHRSAVPGGAAAKAAAGALATLPIARVPNLARSLEAMKQSGLWIVGTAVEAGTLPWQIDLTVPLALVIGSEQKGLRPITTAACDLCVTVPLKGMMESLNASVAAGIMLYEIIRQRRSAAI